MFLNLKIIVSQLLLNLELKLIQVKQFSYFLGIFSPE